MDKKDYAIAFLISLIVSLVIMFSGVNIGDVLNAKFPVFDEQAIEWAYPYIAGVIVCVIIMLSGILAYRLKHSPVTLEESPHGENKE